jgi:hypothetical protein
MPGNLGIENLWGVVRRNMNSFPSSEEELRKKLEDENYERGKPQPSDREVRGIEDLSYEDLLKTYNAGYLPLVDPKVINLISYSKEIYNWYSSFNLKINDNIDSYNKEMNDLWAKLRSDNSKISKQIMSNIKGITSDWLTTGIRTEYWKMISPVKIAKEEGYDVNSLLRVIRDLSNAQTAIFAGKNLQQKVALTMKSIDNVSKEFGPDRAYTLINKEYDALSPLVNKVISGDVDKNSAFLNNLLNGLYYDTKKSLTESKINSEIGDYFMLKLNNKISMTAEEMLDPDVPAPWEK